MIMKISIFSITCLLFVSQIAYSSECDAILEQGVRNTYLMNNGSNFKRNIIANYCKTTTGSWKGNTGGSLGLDIPIVDIPIGIDASYDQNEVKSTSDEVCTNNSNYDEGANFTKVVKLIADPEIVNAWNQCKRFEGGVMLLGKALDDTNISVTMSFRNSGSVYQTTVTEDPAISGMNCTSMVKAGQIINGSTKTYTCKRYGNNPAVLNLNNDYNGVSLYIPQVRYQESKSGTTRPVVKNDPTWEHDGCPTFPRQIGDPSVPIPMIDPQSSCFDNVKKYCINESGEYSFLGTGRERNKIMCPDGRYPIFAY